MEKRTCYPTFFLVGLDYPPTDGCVSWPSLEVGHLAVCGTKSGSHLLLLHLTMKYSGETLLFSVLSWSFPCPGPAGPTMESASKSLSRLSLLEGPAHSDSSIEGKAQANGVIGLFLLSGCW